MAKKRTAKKSARPAAKSAKAEKAAPVEEILLDPAQEKALALVDRSARVRVELEKAVTMAAARAVRKCLKEKKIELTAAQAAVLTAIWFGE